MSTRDVCHSRQNAYQLCHVQNQLKSGHLPRCITLDQVFNAFDRVLMQKGDAAYGVIDMLEPEGVLFEVGALASKPRLQRSNDWKAQGGIARPGPTTPPLSATSRTPYSLMFLRKQNDAIRGSVSCTRGWWPINGYRTEVSQKRMEGSGVAWL